MKYLFGSIGIRTLESLSFTETLYGFDFDGTLVSIAKTPELIRLNPVLHTLLEELETLSPIVIVSGRSVQDLMQYVRLNKEVLIGNHGLEGQETSSHELNSARATSEVWKSTLSDALKREMQDPAVFLEDKIFSLAIHYRNSRNKKRARSKIFKIIETLSPNPRLVQGKCVVNLLPVGGPHKGLALLDYVARKNLKCAFYVGDDDTDEDVFSMPDPRIIGVRVGYKKTSQAKFYIRRQGEIVRLLRTIIQYHKNSPKNEFASV